MYQCENERRKTNPKEKAGIFSLLTFFFTRDLFLTSFRKELEEEDVYNVIKSCKSDALGDRLEREWDKEASRKKPSLFRALMRMFGVEYFIIGLNQLFLKAIIMALQPLLVGKFVAFFSPGQKDISMTAACYYAAGLVLVFLARLVYMHNCMFYIQQLGIKTRVATCSLLYRKSLKLSHTSIMEMSSAKIVTLISKDVYSFDTAIMFGNDLWIGVIQVAIMTYIMYNAIGVSAFLGVAFMAIVVPLQLSMGKVIAKQRKKCAAKTDERLRLTQEILTTMKIIKMYTWELFYSAKTSEERKAEIKKLRLIYYIKSVILSTGTLSMRISFYLSVLVHLYLGEDVTAEKIFVVLSCYSMLRSVLTISIPIGIAQIAEAKASLDRVSKLLRAPNLEEDDESNNNREIYLEKAAPRIQLDNVTVALNATKTIFDNFNLTLTSSLVGVTGPLGSGKSSLLKTILKDLKITAGNVTVYGTASYASQEPWLFPGSLKQNILFGQPFDPERYSKVINLCALRSDIDRFSNGDETTIIDKGLNLSRGQQARVNLARAIYKKADIYLLDDALSSLDTNVSSFIFNNCIKGFLRGKLCVMVTHQQQYLKELDRVLYLRNGQLVMEGSYEEIMRSEYGNEILTNQIDFEDKREEVLPVARQEEIEESELNETVKLLNKKSVYHEEKKSGRVDPKMYKIYLESGGGVAFKIFIVLTLLFATLFGGFFDYYIKRWVDVEEKMSNFTKSNLTNTSEYSDLNYEHNMAHVYYSSLIATTVVFSLVQSISFFTFTTAASVVLHNRCFDKMMRASMEFFDLHLSGNILNRFAKDVGLIDEYLPFIYFEVIRVLFILLSIIVLIAATNYVFLIYSLEVGLIMFVLRRYYLPASRSLKRLDGSTRAPVVGHINASLEGLTTIRASKAQDILVKQFDIHQDLHCSAAYMFMTASRTFGFYLDMCCVFFVIAIVTTFLVSYPNVLAGNVGLAVTQALGLSGLLQWGIRQSAEIENGMTAVERVVEYSTAETEPEDGSTGSAIVKNWPNEGRIEFTNVTLKYSSNSNVILNNLSFEVLPREKVGIIGRTGAGKSSIISTLFRLYEVTGQIIIDNCDIKTLNLKYLRSHLSIIPQDPILFTGTLRTNLDPKNEFSDRDIWSALGVVNVKNIVSNLDAKIEEGGSNYSTGQRQLICLARAVLKKNKVLVLDEATANVDPQTDALIQRTIREQFSKCTVLTIAHRLDTIMDSDKILVLDKGALIEYDSPTNLLGNTNSRFYNMAKQAGLVNH